MFNLGVAKMNRVFVLSSTGKPLAPCHPSRARELLNKGKACIYSKEPFTIMLLLRADGATQNVELKLDPGSKMRQDAVIKSCLHKISRRPPMPLGEPRSLNKERL